MQVQRQRQQTNAERLYFSSITSPYTQKNYRLYLQKYLEYYGMNNVTELLTKEHKTAEGQKGTSYF